MIDYYNDAVTELKRGTNKKGKRSYIPLMFCFAFVITGVWYPAYFMWVVYAFAAYMALIASLFILIGIILLALWLMVRWANKLED